MVLCLLLLFAFGLIPEPLAREAWCAVDLPDPLRQKEVSDPVPVAPGHG